VPLLTIKRFAGHPDRHPLGSGTSLHVGQAQLRTARPVAKRDVARKEALQIARELLCIAIKAEGQRQL